MRSILFEIPLRGRISLGPLGDVPVFGFGLLLVLWALAGAGYWWFRQRKATQEAPADNGNWIFWAIVAGLIVYAPAKESIPIYGFGSMLFLSYLSSAGLGSWRLRRRGLPGEIAWDAAIWVFLSGLFGGRLFYILQYRDRFFEPGVPFGSSLLRMFNLPDGGLVLYGGLLFAPLAFWAFARWKGLRALPLADLLIPSVFIGLMFGRLGCLMHGCCFGDYCELPWAVTFPPDSAPYMTQVARGYLPPDLSSAHSLPLHPTQLYDAFNALAICLLLLAFWPYRQRDGEVLALGWVLYPINRFLIELLRWDELGQFGTRFTISQWGSGVILLAGIAFWLWLQRRPAMHAPLRRDVPVAG
ncbi:MAG: prolipoprotein diacylglyceryl transferase [Planctomycetaceae bacterium]